MPSVLGEISIALPEKLISSEVGWEPMVVGGCVVWLGTGLIKLVKGLLLCCPLVFMHSGAVSLLSSLRALPYRPAGAGPVYQCRARTSGYGWGTAQWAGAPPPLMYGFGWTASARVG